LKDASHVRRLILCSGKVYVDLADIQDQKEVITVAIARVEQLYSFPTDQLDGVMKRYPNLQEVVWLQEEPANMGAWEFIRPRLRELIASRWTLRYIGRPRQASPAEGSSAWHRRNQKAIIQQAFHLDKLTQE
jgi:2-oxoglutarate dehydrogenase E1 component